MGFERKISKKEQEKAIEKFIEGADPAVLVATHNKKKKKEEKWIRLVLRIKADAVNQIDEIVKNQMGMTRTGWILEAIRKNLKRP